ncbi:MAG: hypothetical protein U1U88_001955 [Lawsonella clevelandensis]
MASSGGDCSAPRPRHRPGRSAERRRHHRPAGASRVGFIGGDLLRMAAGTSGDIFPHSHYQSVSKTLEMCPGVAREGLKGSWVFYDGQMIRRRPYRYLRHPYCRRKGLPRPHSRRLQ